MRSFKNNSDGLILIVSLWILVIISLLCLSLAHRVIINLKLVKFQKDRMKCLYIAKAAVGKAISVLESDSTAQTDILSEVWSRGYDEEAQPDGYIFKDVEVADGIFTVSYVFDDSDSELPVYLYGMSDEDRKININEADRELLVSLFEEIGIGSPESLAGNIIYWRGDNLAGSKDPYYESPEIPYPARKAPLRSMQEISLIKDFRENPELIEECEIFFTIFTKENLVNINTTPRQILKAIFMSLGAENVNSGFSDRLADNVIDFRDGADNQQASDDDIAIGQNEIKTALLTGLVELAEKSWVNNKVFPFTVRSNLFRIEVWASLNTSNIHKKVIAVIDRSQRPYKIRYWYEE